MPVPSIRREVAKIIVYSVILLVLGLARYYWSSAFTERGLLQALWMGLVIACAVPVFFSLEGLFTALRSRADAAAGEAYARRRAERRSRRSGIDEAGDSTPEEQGRQS